MKEEMPKPLQFSERGALGASIWVSGRAVQAMRKAAMLAGNRETGGILIGRYGVAKWTADIVEASPEPQGSRAGIIWFQRSPRGLAQLLDDRWRDGMYYLGEWHCHPGGSATPSGPDIQAMQSVSRERAYRCPSPLLLILGGCPRHSWSLSATLFRAGRTVRLSSAELG